MNEITINYILNYIDDCLPEPDGWWDINDFANRSYSRYIAYEIVNMIMDKPLTPAIITIEDFITDMVFLSVNYDGVNTLLRTSIEVAEKLLMHLYAIEG